MNKLILPIIVVFSLALLSSGALAVKGDSYFCTAGMSDPLNFNDTNWSTSASSGGFTTEYCYINYTIPVGSVFAVWNVKDGVAPSQNASITIPNNCFSQPELMLRGVSIGDVNPTNWALGWECYNGATWSSLRTRSNTNKALFEEDVDFIDCYIPANNSNFIVNTTTDICTGYYNNTHIIVDNNNGLLDLNYSTFDGFDGTGVGLDINNQYNQYIHSGYFINYETGIQLTDTNNTDFGEIELSDMAMYGINTYRAVYSDFNDMQIFNSSTGARFNDNSDWNNIYSNSYFEGSYNYGIVFADSDNNIVQDTEITDSMYAIAIAGNDNYILDNDIHYGMYGVVVEIDAVGNTIELNDVYNYTAYGIFINGINANYTFVLDNTIRDISGGILSSGILLNDTTLNVVYKNIIHDVDYAGVEIDDSNYNNITYNTIYNVADGIYTNWNNVQSIGNILSHNIIHDFVNDGIYQYGVYNYTVSYNTIYDSVGGTGINHDSPSNDSIISNNNINNTLIGIDIASDSYGNTLNDNTVTYSTLDGLGIYSELNTITGGTYCYNNQTGFGGWFDIYDDLGANTYSDVICDNSDPNSLCDHPCGYIPPAPATPSNLIVVMEALALLLWIVGGFFFIYNQELEGMELLIGLVFMGVGSAIIISIL